MPSPTQFNPNNIRFFNVLNYQRMAPNEKPTAMEFFFDFTTTLSYVVDLEVPFSRQQITRLVCVYIDNSRGTTQLDIVFNGSDQRITCPAACQGYFPVFILNPPRMTVSVSLASAATNAMIALLNFDVPPAVWGRDTGLPHVVSGKLTADATPQIYPFWRANHSVSGTVAAAGLTNVMFAAIGQAIFVSALEVHLSGNAALLVAGPLTIQLKMGATVLATAIPNLTGVAVNGIIPIWNMTDIGWNGQVSGDDLGFNLSAALNTGSLVYTISAGLTPIIG